MKKKEKQVPIIIKTSLLLVFSILTLGQIAYYLGRFFNSSI